MSKVIQKINLPNDKGYSLENKINEKELDIFKIAITNQWLDKIEEINPVLASKIKKDLISIQEYHKISHLLKHSEIWSKSSRVLPEEFALWFIKSDFARSLSEKYGEFYISDEDNLGWPNIYWRLVRPHEKGDIGPLHRDSWFWELNNDFPVPKYDFYRLKVWLPIFTEIGLNGLLLEPFSQKRDDIEWSGEKRHGINKPKLISPLSKFNPKLIDAIPGNSIVFNDKLIHGGALNKGSKCRVSVEFTMIIKDKK